jgi:hypothetical protein
MTNQNLKSGSPVQGAGLQTDGFEASELDSGESMEIINAEPFAFLRTLE